MPTYTRNANQVPTPIACPTPTLGSPTTPFTTAQNYPPPGTSSKFNQACQAMKMLAANGSGGYGIWSGCALTAGAGLTITVGTGIVVGEGVIELVASGATGSAPFYQVNVPGAYTLAASATNYVWLTATGALVASTGLTYPTGAKWFLGTVTTSGSAVTGIDASGVMLVNQGRYERRTADAGAPTDTPPSGATFFTKTAGGKYWWIGDGYYALQATSIDAMIYRGVIDCSANPNYPAADAGDVYIVSVAGKIGGASGTVVEIGDMAICKTDASVSGTQAGVGANWDIIQTNIDGAVVGPAASVDSEIALYSGTTGKVIKRASNTGMLKATSGVIATAAAGTDYQAPVTAAVLAAFAFGPFTSIASATTTDLSTVATIGVNITGTTTITSFGTGASLLRIGKFAGALTLTHNATSLILPGAANITTVAGDRFIALSDGSGNWTVVAYEKADGTPVSLNFGTSAVETVGTIELGHAGDTTLSRASAGRLAVEGVTVVGTSTTDTLTNKTLTAPIIATISNTGTLTLPTATDTLVGRATTDTLTNKSIDWTNNTVTLTSAQFAAACTDETGTGSVVLGTSPTLTTPLFAIAYGGAGSGGTMTLGSTSHATKGHIYLGSSSKFDFDETNTQLGIAVTPAWPLHISSASNPLSAGAATLMMVDDANKGRIEIRASVNGVGGFVGGGCGGTIASPTACGSGMILNALLCRGYDGSAWTGTVARISFQASSLFSGSNNGGDIVFETTPDGSLVASRAEVGRIASNGDWKIGKSGATGMTAGFPYLPAAAGTPSGTPTSRSGWCPFYYDTTNNKLYVYNGAWKSVTLA